MSEYHFNPNEHLMKIGKGENAPDYLPVQYRLVWVNDTVDRAVADGQEVKLTIDTEEVDCDLDKEFSAEVPVWNSEKRRSEKVVKTAKGHARYKATVTLQIGNMVKSASATKSERAVDFPDFIEKANTGAVGRALAMIGFGTQFAPELEEGHRIVDAPVDRALTATNGNGSNHANTSAARPNGNSTSSASSNPHPTSAATPANDAPVASRGLVLAAQNLYIQAGEKAPDDLAQKSVEEIKKTMEELNAKIREKINKKNGHQESSAVKSPQAAQPTSIANAPSVANLRKRAAAMQVNWDELVVAECKVNKPDDNIIVEERARLKERLDIIAQQRANRAPAEKAS